MTITDDQLVTIEYVLKRADGEVVESSERTGPLTFKMGDRRLLPGLADLVHGMAVGESKTGTIAPGELVPADRAPRRPISRDEFPKGVDPQVGDRFEAHDADGKPVTFEVIETSDDAIMTFILHPLHDVELHYEVTVVSARRPPPLPGEVEDIDDEDLEVVDDD